MALPCTQLSTLHHHRSAPPSSHHARGAPFPSLLPQPNPRACVPTRTALVSRYAVIDHQRTQHSATLAACRPASAALVRRFAARELRRLAVAARLFSPSATSPFDGARSSPGARCLRSSSLSCWWREVEWRRAVAPMKVRPAMPWCKLARVPHTRAREIADVAWIGGDSCARPRA